MTTKQYLSQYRALNDEINSLLAGLTQLRTLMYQSGGGNLNGMPGKKKHNTGANYEALVDKIIDAEAVINDKIDQAVDARNAICAAIEAVQDDTFRRLLRYRYICCYTWERVAVEMNYSWRQVIRLHGNALQKVKMS